MHTSPAKRPEARRAPAPAPAHPPSAASPSLDRAAMPTGRSASPPPARALVALPLNNAPDDDPHAPFGQVALPTRAGVLPPIQAVPASAPADPTSLYASIESGAVDVSGWSLPAAAEVPQEPADPPADPPAEADCVAAASTLWTLCALRALLMPVPFESCGPPKRSALRTLVSTLPMVAQLVVVIILVVNYSARESDDGCEFDGIHFGAHKWAFLMLAAYMVSYLAPWLIFALYTSPAYTVPDVIPRSVYRKRRTVGRATIVVSLLFSAVHLAIILHDLFTAGVDSTNSFVDYFGGVLPAPSSQACKAHEYAELRHLVVRGRSYWVLNLVPAVIEVLSPVLGALADEFLFTLNHFHVVAARAEAANAWDAPDALAGALGRLEAAHLRTVWSWALGVLQFVLILLTTVTIVSVSVVHPALVAPYVVLALLGVIAAHTLWASLRKMGEAALADRTTITAVQSAAPPRPTVPPVAPAPPAAALTSGPTGANALADGVGRRLSGETNLSTASRTRAAELQSTLLSLRSLARGIIAYVDTSFSALITMMFALIWTSLDWVSVDARTGHVEAHIVPQVLMFTSFFMVGTCVTMHFVLLHAFPNATQLIRDKMLRRGLAPAVFTISVFIGASLAIPDPPRLLFYMVAMGTVLGQFALATRLVHKAGLYPKAYLLLIPLVLVSTMAGGYQLYFAQLVGSSRSFSVVVIVRALVHPILVEVALLAYRTTLSRIANFDIHLASSFIHILLLVTGIHVSGRILMFRASDGAEIVAINLIVGLQEVIFRLTARWRDSLRARLMGTDPDDERTAQLLGASLDADMRLEIHAILSILFLCHHFSHAFAEGCGTPGLVLPVVNRQNLLNMMLMLVVEFAVDVVCLAWEDRQKLLINVRVFLNIQERIATPTFKAYVLASMVFVGSFHALTFDAMCFT